MMHSVLVGSFPLVQLLFEWGLRMVLHVDASGFIGPTLATAALSNLLPLTKPIQRARYGFSSYHGRSLWPSSSFVSSISDANFVALTWLIVFLCLFSWATACYVSLLAPELKTLEMPTHTAIGAGAYAVSLLMGIFKERS